MAAGIVGNSRLDLGLLAPGHLRCGGAGAVAAQRRGGGVVVDPLAVAGIRVLTSHVEDLALHFTWLTQTSS
jgi:hypothetical protein